MNRRDIIKGMVGATAFGMAVFRRKTANAAPEIPDEWKTLLNRDTYLCYIERPIDRVDLVSINGGPWAPLTNEIHARMEEHSSAGRSGGRTNEGYYWYMLYPAAGALHRGNAGEVLEELLKNKPPLPIDRADLT